MSEVKSTDRLAVVEKIEPIYQNRIITVQKEHLVLPNGTALALDVIRHPGAAAILPMDGDDVFLIRQYRHAAGKYLYEVPAGTRDGDEDPRVCAERELLEESGFVAGEMLAMGSIFTVPGICDEEIFLFLARQLKKGETDLEDDEVIEPPVRVPYEKALQMVFAGEIQDAKTMAALLCAQKYRI